MKKMYINIFLIAIIMVLVSCSNSVKNLEVEELKQQISDLKNQIDNQSNQTNQQIENTNQTAKNQQTENMQNNNQIISNTQHQFNSQYIPKINIEEAKQISVKNSGFDIKNVIFTKIIKDYDNNILKYEIEFISNNMKYEYDISGYDGTILKYKTEMLSYQDSMIFPNNQQKNIGQLQIINIDSAKNIAMSHAGFNDNDVDFTKLKYDFDNGIAKWEIEFISNNIKYEYDINGYDGTVLKYKTKSVYNN